MSGASFYQDTNPSIASIQSLVDQAVAAEAAAAASASMAAAAVAGLIVSGGGSISVVINKTGASSNAMTVFQDTTSGRARCGLIGDDSFHIQTSGNGSSWVDALTITTAGVVSVATATFGTNTTQVSTTQFVQAAIAPLAVSATVNSALALKAPLASPALTGTPTAPTASALTNSTQLSTTSYVDQAVGVETTRATTAEALKAPLASPTFTGTPVIPTGATGVTQALGDSSTKLATTAFAQTMQSPAFTGSPTAPTQTHNDNSTKLATTAYVNTGVTDGSNAGAGQVGEYISATVLIGAEVSLTTTVAADVTSISLTAGDWEVSGNVVTDAAGTTVTTKVETWINTVSATIPTLPAGGGYSKFSTPATAGIATGVCVGPVRISVSSTTVVYLTTQAQFATSTLKAYGFIGARRVR